MNNIDRRKYSLGKCARSVLLGSYSTFLLATLFYVALQVGFTYIGNCFGALLYGFASDKTAILVSLTMMLCAMIITVPLTFGYVSLIIKVCAGHNASLSELFCYYSDKDSCISAYSCALRLLPIFALTVVLPLVLLPFGFFVIDDIISSVYPIYGGFLLRAVTYILFLIGAVLIFALCFLLSGEGLVRFLVGCLPDKELKIKSFDRLGLFRLRLIMIPLLLLSVLTFGILFIVYTIPFILICYTLFLKLDELYNTSLEEVISYEECDECGDIPTDTDGEGLYASSDDDSPAPLSFDEPSEEGFENDTDTVSTDTVIFDTSGIGNAEEKDDNNDQ